MKRLSAREEQSMGFFWEKGPLFVRQIVEFYEEPRLHFNTVSTFVRGLESQGFLGHRALGTSYQYYPIVTREEYGKSTVRGAISRYFNNSYLSVVSSLVKEEDISLDELKELIRQVEEGNK